MKKHLSLFLIVLNIVFLTGLTESFAVGEEEKVAVAGHIGSQRAVTIVAVEDADSLEVERAEYNGGRQGWGSWFKEKMCRCFSKKSSSEEPFLPSSGSIQDGESSHSILDDTSDFSPDKLKQQFINLEPGISKLPSKLLLAAGGLNEEEREQLSDKQWAAIKGISWVAAFCTACVEGTMTMQEFQDFGEYVNIEINNTGIEDHNFGDLWIIGGITIGTAIIKNYFVSREFLTWLSSSTARYRSFSRRGSNLMSAGVALLAASLGFKPAFTLYEVLSGGNFSIVGNESSYENPLYRYDYIMDLFSVASLFWLASLVQESVSYASADLRSLVRGVKRNKEKGLLYEQKRDWVRRQLAEGFKKLLKKPTAAYQLSLQIKELEEEVEERNESISKEIEALTGEEQAQSGELISRQHYNEAAGNLLILKALVDFSDNRDTEFLRNICQNGPQAFCDDHPGWYKFWYNVGRLVPLVGSIPIWSGWSYAIHEVFSTGHVSSFVVGSVVSAFFLPYMIEGSGRSMANMIARCSNYNPVQGAGYVSAAIENLNYGNHNKALRGFADFVSLISGLLVKVPTALLGLEGMQEFFPNAFGGGGTVEIYMGIFSLLSFGLVARNGAEEAYQGMITKLKCCMGKTPVYKHQQSLAREYIEDDNWVSNLHPDLIYFLMDFLRQDLEGRELQIEE